MESVPPQPSDLLHVIDAIVRTSAGPPGFKGTVSVGVLGAASEAWWTGTFDERGTPHTQIAGEPAPKSCALWMIGEADAERILREGQVADEGAQVVVAGDRALLETFVGRYIIQQKAVALRASGARDRVMQPKRTNRQRRSPR